jgi:hypothetical protein
MVANSSYSQESATLVLALVALRRAGGVPFDEAWTQATEWFDYLRRQKSHLYFESEELRTLAATFSTSARH